MPETINITKVVIAAIGLCSLILTTIIVPYFKTKIKTGNEETDAAKLRNIKEWVKFAVEAAEMIFVGPGRGAEKLDYVMDYITRLLISKGITMDQQQVRIMIESTLLELKKSLT